MICANVNDGAVLLYRRTRQSSGRLTAAADFVVSQSRAMTKKRYPIPPETAARVLFEANRTCGVCRIQSKPIQIHHIDENPANHLIANLAVLCFDCHRETHITGGFDRGNCGDRIAGTELRGHHT